MIEMYLIVPIWWTILILSLLGLIFSMREDKQRIKYWLIFEIILFLCAFVMLVFTMDI